MSKGSGRTRALQALDAASVPFRVHEYSLDGAGDEVLAERTYGEQVARAVGAEPERLFKTLLALASGDPVVAVVPVTTRLGLKQLARAAGSKKAEMMDPPKAEKMTGYKTGGISPFGQMRRLPTFVDETALLWDTVLVSAGQRGLQVEVAPADLVRLLDARVCDLAT